MDENNAFLNFYIHKEVNHSFDFIKKKFTAWKQVSQKEEWYNLFPTKPFLFVHVLFVDLMLLTNHCAMMFLIWCILKLKDDRMNRYVRMFMIRCRLKSKDERVFYIILGVQEDVVTWWQFLVMMDLIKTLMVFFNECDKGVDVDHKTS